MQIYVYMRKFNLIWYLLRYNRRKPKSFPKNLKVQTAWN